VEDRKVGGGAEAEFSMPLRWGRTVWARQHCRGRGEHATAMQAQRVGLRMDVTVVAIREEGESGDFLSWATQDGCVRVDGSVTCWAVQADVEAHPRASGRPTRAFPLCIV
jgi:hypothetical protein